MKVDPQRLSRAADGLAAAGAELAGRDRCEVGDGWAGGAARAAAQRHAELGSVEERLASRLDSLAAAVADAARRAVALEAAGEAVEQHLARQLALVADAGAAEAAAAVMLHSAVCAARAERDAVRARLAGVGHDLAESLDRSDPVSLVPEPLRHAVAVVAAGAGVVTAARRGSRYARWLSRALDPATRGAAAEVAARARFVAGWAPRVPWVERLLPGASRTFLPLAVAAGARDVVTGGGRSGAAGGVTRVLGAGAVAAGALLLVGVGPEIAVVAGGVLVAHALWSAGTAVWDQRATISGWLQRAGGSARRGVARGAAAAAVADTAARVATGGAARVSDAAADVAETARGLAGGLVDGLLPG